MLILASQSPRRQELLERAGFSFIVRVSGVPEVRLPGERPGCYVQRLARAKAESVECGAGDVVLAADTVVVLDEHVLEKPDSEEDARRMLRVLSGRRHAVMTGVCLRTAGQITMDFESTLVRFAALTEDEIDAYVRTGEPMDKAGAYAIQGYASKFVDRIEGCYFNVVGLPVALVFRRLKELQAASGQIFDLR